MSQAILKQKLDSYYLKVKNDWKNKHPQQGRPFPKGGIDLRSNDYLSLAGNQNIVASKKTALEKYTHGNAQSRIWTYHQDDIYQRFEHSIASHCGYKDAIITPSGYSANTGLICTFCDKSSIVYIDEFAHASLWEGLKLTKSNVIRFQHNNMTDLRAKIQQYGAGFIIVDSLYSTFGSLCPLEKLVEIAKSHDCVTIVDETHSMGTHGIYGEGLTKSKNLHNEIDFITFGLSKAFAVRGGIISGKAEALDVIRYSSIPVIFTNGVLAYEVAGYLKTLEIIRSSHDRRKNLHNNYTYLKEAIRSLGIQIPFSESQIISLEIGSDIETMKVRDILESYNVFSSYFFYPAVKKERSLLRFTVNCSLTSDELNTIVLAIKEVTKIMNVKKWVSSTSPILEAA